MSEQGEKGEHEVGKKGGRLSPPLLTGKTEGGRETGEAQGRPAQDQNGEQEREQNQTRWGGGEGKEGKEEMKHQLPKRRQEGRSSPTRAPSNFSRRSSGGS